MSWITRLSTPSLETLSSVSSTGSDSFNVVSEESSSDEEIVWLNSPSTESSLVASTDSDEEYVVFHRPLVAATAVLVDYDSSPDTSDNIVSSLQGLSLRSGSPSDSGEELPSVEPQLVDVAHVNIGGKLSKTARRNRRRKQKLNRLSSSGSSETDSTTSRSETSSPTSSYQEASNLISAYLDDPHKADISKAPLPLLQAFIIELGLSSSSPPSTLTSAKKLLKDQAHVNIKDYVAVRGRDQCALQKIMHPSKSALAKEIRRSGKRASLKWVKKQGLQVFLVACFQ